MNQGATQENKSKIDATTQNINFNDAQSNHSSKSFE
jgi:hypothetical protein